MKCGEIPSHAVDNAARDASSDSKYEHIFVVIRGDSEIEHPEYVISLTKAYANQAEAEKEAARMNELNGPKGARYFVQIARVVPSERET